MQRHTKENALKAMREFLAVATKPHDRDMIAQKLTKKGLSFTGEMLFPWLMQMVVNGEILQLSIPDGEHEFITVFERPNVELSGRV